jgi:phosphatidylglycerol:prolipoprotein diacylglycerol transferase
MPTLAAYFHDLNPIALDLGVISLKWYGMAYAAGFVIAWLILRWFAKRGVTPLSPLGITDAMLALVLGVVVGGRLGYVLIYGRELITEFNPSFPWWAALDISRGGMASHGGIVGVIIASYWIAARAERSDGTRGTPVLHVIDLTAIACTIGLGLGRVANFVNGELLGKVVAYPGEKAPWWAVRFPQEFVERRSDMNLTPQQELELIAIAEKYTARTGLGGEDAYDAMLRLLQSDRFTGKHELIAQLEPLISARHPSQIYQALAEGVLLTIVLWIVWRVPRKPGIVGAWFLVTYGVLRVITEFWRLPDAQFGDDGRPFGLSRGQWLSVAMVVIGAVAMWICAKRKVDRMGGWQHPAKPANPSNPTKPKPA